MKRRDLFIALVLVLLLLLAHPALAVSPGEEGDRQAEELLRQGVEQQLNSLDLSGLEAYYDPTAFEGKPLMQLLEEMSREGLRDLSVEEILSLLWEGAKEGLLKDGGAMVRVLVLIAITGVLQHIRTSFDRGEVAQTGMWAGYVVVAGMTAAMVTRGVGEAKAAMDSLLGITEGVTPLLTALLSGLGGVRTSAIMSPVLAALTGTVFALIKNIVFPVVLVSAALGMTAHFSPGLRLEKMADLLHKSVKWFLGIIMVVFLGVLALKGISGAAIDSLTFRTAKYTIDKMVPYIGGMFSDSLDTLMACGVIVKNSVGIAGLLILLMTMAAPLLKLGVQIFLFRGAAALAQPFGEQNSLSLLGSLADSMKLLLVALLACTAMAFISVALLMGAADMTMTLR